MTSEEEIDRILVSLWNGFIKAAAGLIGLGFWVLMLVAAVAAVKLVWNLLP